MIPRSAAVRVVAHLTSLPGNVRGALWVSVAAIFFTIMVALIKVAGQHLAVSQILLLRQCIMFLAVLPVVVRNFPQNIITTHPLHHMLRVVVALTAMYAGFTAAIHLPLADVTAIGFSRTFFVTIFAIVLLGEIVGWRRWLAISIGFAGVLIMLRPGTDGMSIYGLLAVAGALCAGLVAVIVRYLSRFEAPVTILTYQAVFVGVLVAPLAIWQWRPMSHTEWLLILAIGLTSVCGQLCNIRAYRAGEASVVASVDYVRLLWATLLGYIMFANLPTMTTLAGAAIIVVASLYTMIRELRVKRRIGKD